MNFRKKINEQRATFQMAPMVDIMFLLLIFFMVSALYAQWETRIDVKVPTAETGDRAERQAGEIIINVTPKGSFIVNQVEVNKKRLTNILTKISKQFPDQPIIIRADSQTPHKYVVTLLDICRKVDIWNIAFATQRNEKSD